MKKIVFILSLVSLISCHNKEVNYEEINVVSKTPLMIEASDYFKPISMVSSDNIPDNFQELNNPVNITSVKFENRLNEKELLGQKLYYDKRLSKNGTISCNSCHNLDTYGVDNSPFSLGDTKEFGGRNSPSSIYAALHFKQFWDGRAKDVEEQAGMPILNPVEHGIPSQEFLVNRLRGIEEYQQFFKKVFPNDNQPINYTNLTNAIGAFERKLMPESRFDRWLDGEDNALDTNEKEGLKSFINNGCIACHSGVAIGGQMMQKFGVSGNYWEYTKSKNIDNGLFDITKNESDKYVFKVPSLRNIEKTYPYFHDGSVKDLSEAVKIMGKLQSNKELSETEVKNIVAFLKTLTAEVDPKFKKADL
ncbi:MAG: cytochrome-c peroxidase [Flavobacterium sp.]|nr:cytochrome-c peroxidase [Flavobacterium sp.]